MTMYSIHNDQMLVFFNLQLNISKIHYIENQSFLKCTYRLYIL